MMLYFRYLIYVMKLVDLLIHHGVKPILVFDGFNLPAKAGTEKKRREYALYCMTLSC